MTFFAFNPLSRTVLMVIALRSPFVTPVSTHVKTSLQSEFFLLGITYQQLSLLHRLSVYLKNVSQKWIGVVSSQLNYKITMY